MPSCIGHGTDPCRCFDSPRPAIKAEPPFLFVNDKPCVTGEAIKAGTEVIIKDGKLYARPATDLELMTKERDELMVEVGDLQSQVHALRAEMVHIQKSADNRQDHLSAQLSAALRENMALQGRLNRG